MTEIGEPSYDLLHAARCEDLKYSEIRELTVLGDFEMGVIDTLAKPGAHLLEGARGSGKSMLLRSTEIDMDKKFQSQKNLPVYVNFKTSTLLDGVKAGERDGFQLWVNTKILQALHYKLRQLGLIQDSDKHDPYKSVFGISTAQPTGEYLKEKIHLLQRLAFTDDKSQVIRELGDDFMNQALDTGFLTEMISSVISEYNLNRIVFLFDEAAHTFIPQQQEIFFEIFKLLHGNTISCKAAVYPSVTSYGRNFEIGQDAIVIGMDRFEPGENGRKARRQQFRKIVDKRIPEGDPLRKKVFSRGELLDICIELSTGNPRAFLHLFNRAVEGGFSDRAVNLGSQGFVDEELLPYHENLAKRIPKFAVHVGRGLELLRNYIIPEIRKKNFRVTKSGYQSAFFTIGRDISPNLKLAFDMLCYSGILAKKGTVKIAGRETGLRYMIHLSLMSTEKAFKYSNIRESLKNISLTDYREFANSDSAIEEIVEKMKDAAEQCTACAASLPPGAKFCSECGGKVEPTPIIIGLLEESINSLSISERLKDRVRPAYPRVGDVVQAPREGIMEIKYIKEVRSRIIKNAADEYISG